MADNRIWVCSSGHLAEGDYIRVKASYKGNPGSVVVFKHSDKHFAYLNRCVHMPRELDCEHNTIFDDKGQLLRCSMHGIVYDPMTGESLSTMCNGEKLTSIRIIEDQEGIWIKDKKVRSIDENH